MTKIREVTGFNYIDRDMTETEQEQFDKDYADGLIAAAEAEAQLLLGGM